MAFLTQSQTAASHHVPAWKRLGLKLKSAPVATENQEPIAGLQLAPTPGLNTNSKRQRSDQLSYSTDTPPAKKVKKSKSLKPHSSPPLADTHESHSPSLKKRKSVTFTPETKIDDGDSIKQLFNTWVDQQKEQDPSFGANRSIQAFQAPEPSQVAERVEDPILNESEKRVKRVKRPEKAKKEKGLKNPSGSLASQRLSPALSYLRQHHDSRDTWKFNKNHQNFIIKHVFYINKIPLDYTEVLHHYITGMQGIVRTRLRDEAIKVKVQDQEAGAAGFPSDMSDPDQRQQEYDTAMSEYVANVTMRDAPLAMGYEEGIAMNLSDFAMRERVGKRMRAERILAQLGRDAESSQGNAATDGGDRDGQKRIRLNDGTAQKMARRRKQRTTAADDDDTSSSSSSDDSSSESESDSDDSSDSEESEGRAARDNDETSSSSSSSSSSGSESESESGDSDDNSEEE